MYQVVKCCCLSFHGIHHKIYPVLHCLHLNLPSCVLAFSSQVGAFPLPVCLLGALLSASSSSRRSFPNWWWLLWFWWLMASSLSFYSCLIRTSSTWFCCTRALFYWVSCSMAAESICSCFFTTVGGFPISGLIDAIDQVWTIWTSILGIKWWLITRSLLM